jgi:ABC-type multidrug transport system fused ATPase/permease subunit
VYYGGYDLETIDLRYLRRQLGAMLQNGVIPLGKLIDVIADNPRISEKMIWEALDKVDLLREAEALPRGLHTPLEQCAFSAAEYQRLMIARSLVNPRRFVFFHEPTSRQDNITQRRLLEHIYALRASKIIVAQRIATVKDCDFMVAPDQGTVVRQETHGNGRP